MVIDAYPESKETYDKMLEKGADPRLNGKGTKKSSGGGRRLAEAEVVY